MRQDQIEIVAKAEAANNEVNDLAYEDTLVGTFDPLDMSDEETLAFAHNPDFTQQIGRSAQTFADEVNAIQSRAETSQLIYVGGNRYHGMGEASDFANAVADAASALTMDNAENNPDRYREALDDFMTNLDEFDRPFERGVEEVMYGYRDAGNRLDNLVDRQLRADGKPMTVYRGVTVKGVGRKRLLDAINAGVKTYKLDGIASTSTDGYFAHEWATGSYPILMRMRVKNGLFVGAVSANPGESEVIIPKGSEFKIKSVERISTRTRNGNHSTMVLVDMEEAGIE